MGTVARLSVSLVAGAALAGCLAGTAQAAAPAGAKQNDGGWIAGQYRDYGSCQAAGRQGQHRHAWSRFDCDRSWDDHGRDHDHGQDHGRGDRHHDDHDQAWVLKVYRWH